MFPSKDGQKSSMITTSRDKLDMPGQVHDYDHYSSLYVFIFRCWLGDLRTELSSLTTVTNITARAKFSPGLDHAP